MTKADLTLDTALGGEVKVYQPAKGYRFSVDAVLLARFATEFGGDYLIDLCSGSGVVGLCTLALGGARRVLGIELQPCFVEMARRSVQENGWSDRVEFAESDVSHTQKLFPSGAAQLVVANPPYHVAGSGRVGPDESMALARHELKITLVQVSAAASHLLENHGYFCSIIPAQRLSSLMEACREVGLEPKVLRMIHSREGEAATLAMLAAQLGGSVEGLRVEPALILHPGGSDQRKYSDEAEALLGRGGVVAV